MKRILLIASLIIHQYAQAQLKIMAGTKVTASATVQINLGDIDFMNDGMFSAGNSSLIFSGNNNNGIKGNTTTSFYKLIMDKSGNQKLMLETNVNVTNSIIFSSGLLDLNNKLIDLGSTGTLSNENENSRIVGAGGGFVQATQLLNSPSNSNPGGLGAFITSAANLGNVTIRRGHKEQSGPGITNGILRYFEFSPANNQNLNASLRFTYFESELNDLNEDQINLFKSFDNGVSWTLDQADSINATSNYVKKSGIGDLKRWTLSAVNPPMAQKMTAEIKRELAIAPALKVWPVPSSGPVNILVTGIEKPEKLLIIDMAGRVLISEIVGSNKPIRLPNLMPGTYFASLASKNGAVQKFIIQ